LTVLSECPLPLGSFAMGDGNLGVVPAVLPVLSDGLTVCSAADPEVRLIPVKLSRRSWVLTHCDTTQLICLRCFSAGIVGFPGICGRRLSDLDRKRAPFRFFGVEETRLSDVVEQTFTRDMLGRKT
jgi:hypothetical protein